MNTEKIIESLQLNSEFGWELINLKKWNKDSFYSYMIENGSFCLGWISFVSDINENNLQKHHFSRNENSKNNNNNLPKLLIVTNGKNWFLSKMGSKSFTEVKKETILTSIYETVKTHSKVYTMGNKEEINNSLSNFLESMKKEIAKLGITEKERKLLNANLFSTEDEFTDEESCKAMYEVIKMRSEVLELSLNLKNAELNDLKTIMHQFLVQKYTPFALFRLIDSAKRSGKHTYVCTSEEHEQLLFRFFDEEIYSKQFHRANIYGQYTMIRPDGHFEDYIIEFPGGEKKSKPLLFKLDITLLSNLLTNK